MSEGYYSTLELFVVPAEVSACEDRRPFGCGFPRDACRLCRGVEEAKEWVPVTKISCLVEANKITSLKEIYLLLLPIKKPEIVDALVPDLKEEVIQVFSIQK